MFKKRALTTAHISFPSTLTLHRHLTLATARAQHTRAKQNLEPSALSTVAALALSAHHLPQRTRSAQPITTHSARAHHRPQPHRARSAQATGLAAAARSALAIALAGARALSTENRTGCSAGALHRPQNWPQNWQQRKGSGHITGRSARALHKPQHWPQRARSAQKTGLAASRALFTGRRTGRSASAQSTYLAAARALSTDYSTGRSARALHRPQHWPKRGRSALAI